MAAFAIEPPFWERERGGGPITSWMRSRERDAADEARRQFDLMHPSGYRPPRLSKQERYDRGLCQSCPARTEDGRWLCTDCGANLALRRRRAARG